MNTDPIIPATAPAQRTGTNVDAPPIGEVSWLLENFARKVPGVASTVVVSADGLLLAMTTGLERTAGDHIAAVTSGIASLTGGAARVFAAGEVRQVIVEMSGGFLFVTSISDGSHLAVLTRADADIGMVGYEMTLLVARVGELLTPALRAQLQSLLPR